MLQGKYVVSGILVIIALAATAYWRYAPPMYAGTDATLTTTEEALAAPVQYFSSPRNSAMSPKPAN